MHLKLDLGAIMSSDQPLQFFRSLHQSLVMLNVPQLHVVHGTFRHSWAIPHFPPVSGRMMCPNSGDWCSNQVAKCDTICGENVGQVNLGSHKSTLPPGGLN